MEKPLKGFIIIMPQAENPKAVTLFILDAVIVAVLSRLQPPLLLYALRSIGPDDLVYLSAMPEQHRRIIRDRCGDINALRP